MIDKGIGTKAVEGPVIFRVFSPRERKHNTAAPSSAIEAHANPIKMTQATKTALATAAATVTNNKARGTD